MGFATLLLIFLELASHTKHTAVSRKVVGVCPPTRDTSQRINILRCAPRYLYFWMMSFGLCLNQSEDLMRAFLSFWTDLLLRLSVRVSGWSCSLFHKSAAVTFDGHQRHTHTHPHDQVHLEDEASLCTCVNIYRADSIC